MDKLKFNKNGKFIIMQVSDCQDLHIVRKTMIRMLCKAYDMVNPDLVVLTGDNILGNHLRDALIGSRHVIHTKEQEYDRMKTAINHIIAPLEMRKIPFTMIYGNHDDMNEITKEEQADIYRAYPMCKGLDNSDKTVDADTFNLPIYSSDGSKKVFNLWMLDSAYMDKAEKKCHSGVTKETLSWYVNKSNELKEENGGKPLPSIMFQHIIMPECAALMKKCSEHIPNAVAYKNKDTGETEYYCLDETKATGFIGEAITGYKENFGQFDTLKQQGDVLAVVSGHDHKNNFEGELEGIKIIQSSAASFRCYGNRLRGVRVFEIDENNPTEFNTYFLTYEDICGKGILNELSYILDADGMEKQKYTLLAGFAATLGIGITAAIKLLKK